MKKSLPRVFLGDFPAGKKAFQLCNSRRPFPGRRTGAFLAIAVSGMVIPLCIFPLTVLALAA